MWSRFITNINFLFILLAGLLLLALQTTLCHVPSSGELQPEFLLLIIIYLGLNRGPLEGILISFILGYFIEVHSGVPLGATPLAALLIFIIVRILSHTIFIPSIASSIGLVMTLTLLWRAIIGFATYWKTDNYSWVFNSMKFIIPAMILHGLLYIPVFNFIRWIDQKTGKEPVEA
jgi:rod shape-determining protein MreD